MEDPPPSRRARRPPSIGPSVPLVPILLAVIVVGFAIGAGLSLLGRGRPNGVVALATATPKATVPPPRTTAAPTSKPRAAPTRFPAAPTPEATPAPKPTSEPSPLPAATVRATPAPAPSRVILVRATPQATARASSVKTPQSEITAQPSGGAPRATVPSEPTSGPTDQPAASDQYDSDFARLSAGVVRQYLNSVIRGDQTSAYAALGAQPGDRNASLSEQPYLDSTTRILKIEAHGTDDRATVYVDLQSARGTFFEQFNVRRTSTGAAVIRDHSIIKP